jgi:hypothetical protein
MSSHPRAARRYGFSPRTTGRKPIQMGKIAFSTSKLGGRNPKSEIRVLDVASRRIDTLPGSQGMFSPRWPPDGRLIAAVNRHPRHLRSHAGREVIQLVV